MEILVFSDSHGNLENMVQAAQMTPSDMIVHLGDGWGEAQRLHRLFPQRAFCQVVGNCDFRPGQPVQQLIQPQGRRILLCHGHTLGVKQSLIQAGYTAESMGLDALLFGHTHKPFIDWRMGALFFNPGSIGDRLRPFYGLLTLEDGRLDGRTVPLA